MASRPYAAEEVLSFNRINRAVTSRVLEAVEPSLQQGLPVETEKLAELVTQEWKAVKEAVMGSPMARERALEYMRRVVGELVDARINSEKGELESLGVEEKYV
ncbi:MAG TPA: hypothetical protein VJL08_03825 [Dehalococcoidia bacterium]|nr:hypothetical protein [Dehalococcoidia bacterium]